MVDYIETKTKDGTNIRIEVEFARTGAGFGYQGSGSQQSDQVTSKVYDQALATIRACASGVIETLQNLETRPNAASVDFAIKVDAEAGPMVAKSGGDAQFKISLSWKQAEPEEDEA